MVGVATGGDRLKQCREASLRTLRARVASAMIAPCPSASPRDGAARASTSAKPSWASSRAIRSGSFESRALPSGARLSKILPARSTCGRRRSSKAPPSVRPCSLATLSRALWFSGKQMGLRVVDHLDAMLDGAEQPIGVGKLVRLLPIEPVRTDQRSNRVERRRQAYCRRRGHHGSSAGSGRRTRLRGCRHDRA